MELTARSDLRDLSDHKARLDPQAPTARSDRKARLDPQARTALTARSVRKDR
jgi:hypothetical protein